MKLPIGLALCLIVCASSSATLLSAPAQAADMPGEIAQVPLYPGARAVPPDPYGAPPDPKVAEKEYVVDADLDKVYEFYRKQYPASLPGPLVAAVADGKPDARHMGDGTLRHANGFEDCVRTSKVPAWEELADGGQLIGRSGTEEHYSKAETLALRRKVRGARPNDQWRTDADLNWCVRPDARNFVQLDVVLRDDTRYDTVGRPQTSVVIRRRVIGSSGSVAYSSAEGPLGGKADQDRDSKMMMEMIDGNPNLDAATKAAMKQQMKDARQQYNAAVAALPKQAPATAARDTDMPVYPGALLDTKATDSMGVMGAATPWRNYLYYSEDELAKVRAYYEQRADRKAAQQADSRIIVLRQGANAQSPELTVTLKPANDAGMKTEIMIRVRNPVALR